MVFSSFFVGIAHTKQQRRIIGKYMNMMKFQRENVTLPIFFIDFTIINANWTQMVQW